MLRSIYTYLIIALLLIAGCSKEEPNSEIIENECSEIIEFRKEVDFLELFGQELSFQNIETGEEKILSYNAQRSSSTLVKQTILCTKLQYEDNITLVYESPDGADIITYFIKQYFNNAEFGLSIDFPNIIIGGVDFPSLQFITNETYLSNINDSDKRLVYLKDNRILGIDNLNGSQWLLDGENENIFYCGIKDNFSSYRNTQEFSSFVNLAATKINYNDGLIPTLSFTRESQNIFNRYNVVTNNSCAQEQLELNEITDLWLQFRFSSFYSMTFNYSILFESIESEQYSSVVDVAIYHSGLGQLHHCTLIEDKVDQIDTRIFMESEHTLHDQITLADVVYTQVYEISNNKGKMYFNFEKGVIAFTDHLDEFNYLIAN